MSGKILYIEEVNFENEHILKNLPYDTDYIIFGMVKNYLYDNILDVPCACRKIIILNYETSIDQKGIKNYINNLAGKLPFGCEIMTVETHKGASFTWANSNKVHVEDKTYYDLIKFNKIIPKGVYDLEILNRDGVIRSDLNLFHKSNKILYFKYSPLLPK
jgi:hypothetical protein